MSNNYKAVMMTRTASPAWSWEFDESNDEDAIKRLERVMKCDFAGVEWVMSINLVTTSTLDGMVTFDYERHVASLSVTYPVIHIERVEP